MLLPSKLLLYFSSFSILQTAIFAAPSCARSIHDDLPLLLDATLDELVAGLEAGKFTSVDLVNAYTARILEVNSTLSAVTELNPSALSIASHLDAERSHGTTRGPLHGIPILLKNNIATFDLMNNTAGSYALLGATVPRDATVAAKLRKAGAVLLGKTNLSQWANFRSSNSSNGWSALGGQTLAAYYANQDPCGSSSGSGVASSLGLALASLGTETDGSIVCPSDANNLVGIKPTVGLTSRSFVIPISEVQDTVGPMARTVKDAAYILQAIAGYDAADPATSGIPFKNGSFPDYVMACKHDALDGVRIGVPRNSFYASGPEYDAIFAAFESALTVLSDAGATVVDNTNYTAFEDFFNSDAENIVLSTDFLANLPEYLSQLASNPNDITDVETLRSYTQSDPRESFPDRNTAVWDAALASNITQDSPEYAQALEDNAFFSGEGGLLGALDTYSLSAVVVPTAFSSPISAVLGGPIVTVPLGSFPNTTGVFRTRRGLVTTAPNVPFGISFVGPKWSEELLIGLAYAFEQRTNVRRKIHPVVQPGTELRAIVDVRQREKMPSTYGKAKRGDKLRSYGQDVSKRGLVAPRDSMAPRTSMWKRERLSGEGVPERPGVVGFGSL